MEAPERGALMFVRFVAAALIGWAVVDFSLYVVVCRHNGVPLEIWPCILKNLPFLAGVIILAMSKTIAEWLAETLDL